MPLVEENKKILQEARAEREALLKEARTSGSDLLAKAKEDAKLEADKILSQAQDVIQNEKRTAINELKNQVAQISLEIAEKLIEGELEDIDKQTSLVEKLLKDAFL